ncbi:hypothetical protein O1W71_10890 [Microbacterium sp. H37-C3]|uniref:hypothetical protein n=1 Tax=Microbacterium sp. H37-C3 TaxID=3004354 RepID=UPI0022AE9DA6|nr:hypothetical protein [Microbacterium sp. H37-C3]MCZ4068176.1 hypothetical protein [Microbacterium sp. H37-C3]
MSARRSIRSSVAVLAAWVCAVALLVAAPVALSSSIAPAPAAAAASGADFNPGNIISDAAFYDSNAMGSPEIQAFMERQVRSCSSGYTCLKDYRQNTDTRPADRYCNGYEGRGNESASTIIDRVARSCGISQKVILVLLEKEQSLVTSTAPSARDYAAATGQGCPDTAPCDSATLGFFYQVYYAARQYKIYKAFPRDFGYQAGRWNNILYHPYNNCGTQRVYIENQATAGLYIYTPYVPNQAALNNMYGEGDTCSSYGNRNFWRLYTDWFGSTQADLDRAPFGGYNLVVERGLFTVQGWALDPDEPSTQLTISLKVDGKDDWARFTANSYRPDVGAVHAGYGNHHGMDSSFEIEGGSHEVCVIARNVGRGVDTTFGCTTIDVVTASPYGGSSLEVQPGGVHITGWTLDTDTKDSLAVHVWVDDKPSAYIANAYRPDIPAVFPGWSDRHGIDIKMPVSAGRHNICVYAINVGRGSNKLLECYNVDIPSGSPFGSLDSVVAVPGGLQVRGWAIDPNTKESIAVHAWRGSSVNALRASKARPDVAIAYPDFGEAHGFDDFIAAPAGDAQVCAYGINVGWGDNSLLSCKTATVMTGSPFGGIDTTVVGTDVRLRGWTIDPDTTSPIDVHVYVDGGAFATKANVSRPDVGRVYPGYGSAHGIDTTFSLSEGTHRLCAYGINVGTGTNALLGCSDVTMPRVTPFGGTDATVDGRSVILRGWTIDPDTVNPIQVHVYANGSPAAVVTANAYRPDVGAAYPGFGNNHGIETRLSLPAGKHQICSYGINVGLGSANTLLGCQNVTVR